ncbi:metallophosphoesterase family protein [Candidatus Omnitrophota bacterium]
MRIALLADIHSNLEALSAVESKIKKLSPDKVICLGDIVGYGPRPNECIDLVRANSWQTVCGNHDWAARQDSDVVLFNPYAREAMLWTRASLNAGQRLYLNSLDLTYRDDSHICVHASLFEPDKFHYLDSYNLFDRDAALLAESGLQILFVAHTHIPAVFIHKGDNLYRDYSRTVELSAQYRYIVNAGSVGQPRDRDSRSCFCLYDTQSHSVEFVRVAYDIDATKEDILSRKLPGLLAERLSSGW